jgi:hypothetical protein
VACNASTLEIRSRHTGARAVAAEDKGSRVSKKKKTKHAGQRTRADVRRCETADADVESVKQH